MEQESRQPFALNWIDRIGLIANYIVFTLRRFYADGLMQSVAALTYSTLLALVPLLVIAFAIFSAFPTFEAVQERIRSAIFSNLLPETGVGLRAYLEQFTSNASELTGVGVVALAFSAILLLSTIESTLNRIWRVERERPFINRLLVFWTLLTLGPLLLGASFTVSSDFLAVLREWTGEATDASAMPGWLRSPFAAAIQAAAFTAIFKLVPARPVRLLDAGIGGIIAGTCFEGLKWGFQAFLANSSTYTTIYGAVAAVPVFLIWTYACWTVIIIGAVFAASLPDWRRDRSLTAVEDLDAPQRLSAALSVLGMLAERTRRDGGSVGQDTLAETLPLASHDELMELLISQGYVVETAQAKLALARDLHHVTLTDLARDLGLLLGKDSDIPGASEKLLELLDRLAEAEERILGASLAELIEQPGTIGTGD